MTFKSSKQRNVAIGLAIWAFLSVIYFFIELKNVTSQAVPSSIILRLYMPVMWMLVIASLLVTAIFAFEGKKTLRCIAAVSALISVCTIVIYILYIKGVLGYEVENYAERVMFSAFGILYIPLADGKTKKKVALVLALVNIGLVFAMNMRILVPLVALPLFWSKDKKKNRLILIPIASFFFGLCQTFPISIVFGRTTPLFTGLFYMTCLLPLAVKVFAGAGLKQEIASAVNQYKRKNIDSQTKS